jgi:hypothetical protein
VSPVTRATIGKELLKRLKEAYLDGYKASGTGYYDEDLEALWEEYAESKGYKT